MARPLRITYPGAFYHVTSRGNERKDIFDEVESVFGKEAALGRNIKMFLCRWYTDEKLKDIGVYFGLGKSRASQACRRVKDKSVKNEDLTPCLFMKNEDLTPCLFITLKLYKKFIQEFINQGYCFQTFEEQILNSKKKVVILRHDVDHLPNNALAVAKIEKDFGLKASYYFRIVKESYDENIIKQIAELGHEIGYHYEDLSLCKGNYESAIKQFKLNLKKFRKIYPVKTICMHGSPLSKWDNRDLWKKYDYRDFGIIAEPYFDIDFNDVFYLTDTGRRWDGSDVSVRDKVAVKGQNAFDNLKFRSTMDIIKAAQKGLLPGRIMINTHPQRWDDRFGPWVWELVWQNFKNVVKRIKVLSIKF